MRATVNTPQSRRFARFAAPGSREAFWTARVFSTTFRREGLQRKDARTPSRRENRAASLRLHAARSNGIEARMVGTLALNLTFSPRRRNSIWQSSGFADDRPANSAARISVRRETILLLLGEKAGMREVVTNH